MMNTSLSTVDGLFSSLPNGNLHTNSERNSINSSNNRVMALNVNNIDENRLDKTSSSPSFNSDSEPPSYFEAVGISHVNVNADVNSFNQVPITLTTISEQISRPSKLCVANRNSSYLSNKDYSFDMSSPPSILYSNDHQHHRPNHQRHHVIRAENLPPTYNFSCQSAIEPNFINNNSVGSFQKPSETYMVWSIFTTIYCVFIGIIALVLSIKIHHYNKIGDYQKAYSRSRIARNLNIAGLFFGFIYMGIGLLACFLPR